MEALFILLYILIFHDYSLSEEHKTLKTFISATNLVENQKLYFDDVTSQIGMIEYTDTLVESTLTNLELTIDKDFPGVRNFVSALENQEEIFDSFIQISTFNLFHGMKIKLSTKTGEG